MGDVNSVRYKKETRCNRQPKFKFSGKNQISQTYTTLDNSCTNFANIQRIVVTSATLSIGVDKGGVLPCLGETPIVEKDVSFFELSPGGLQCNARKRQKCESFVQHIGAYWPNIRSSMIFAIGLLTSRSFPFFSSCLIGVNSSSVAISYFFLR